MKLKPYKEILAMTKEKLDSVLAPIRAKRAKAQAELEITKMEEQMATKEAQVHELCAEKDIDFNKIIEAQNQYSLMERKKKQFELIIKQMFPK